VAKWGFFLKRLKNIKKRKKGQAPQRLRNMGQDNEEKETKMEKKDIFGSPFFCCSAAKEAKTKPGLRAIKRLGD